MSETGKVHAARARIYRVPSERVHRLYSNAASRNSTQQVCGALRLLEPV